MLNINRIRLVLAQDAMSKRNTIACKLQEQGAIRIMEVPDNGGPDNGGPDNGGPDNGGPDNGGPDNGGPDNGGPDNGGSR